MGIEKRITDEDLETVFKYEVLLYQYWKQQNGSPLSSAPKPEDYLTNEDMISAHEYLWESDTSYRYMQRDFDLFASIIEHLLAFYQTATEPELLFSRMYDDLKSLTVEELKWLSIRLEIMAKEMEAKQQAKS